MCEEIVALLPLWTKSDRSSRPWENLCIGVYKQSDICPVL